MSDTSSRAHATERRSAEPAGKGSNGPGNFSGGQPGSPPIDDGTVISAQPPMSLVDQPLAVLTATDAELIGRTLGQFQIAERVGGGGMALVYRAYDSILKRWVALKVLPQESTRDAEIVRRFQFEAQSAARLDHENIARVYYAGEERGWHYIAFEYVEGKNVRDVVAEQGPLSLGAAISLTVQIASGLAHSSSRGVVHRDVKPSNVVIMPEGRIKLVDMGLARLAQEEQSEPELTASGVTLGTFDYLAPEQARDPRVADVRSDLYSLGCTFFYVLTGRPPFADGTVLQKLLQHQGDDPPDPREYRPNLPDEIEPIVKKLMAKSPSARYQSPGELIADLLHFARLFGIPINAPPEAVSFITKSREVSAWERHIPWLVPVALLIVFVLVFDLVSRREFQTSDQPLAFSNGARDGFLERNRPIADDSAEDKVEQEFVAEANATKGQETIDPKLNSQAPTAPAEGSRSESGESSTITSTQRDLELAADEEPRRQDPPKSFGATDAASSSQKLATGRPANSSIAGEVKGVAKVDGVWVVDQFTPGGLRAACETAKPGDIIELRFDSRRVERPLKLPERVTIRGKDGQQPVLLFRPSANDPTHYPRAMLSLAGEATLVNVHLELDVPSARQFPVDSWSLFELDEGDALRLDGCTLTINNAVSTNSPLHPNVRFLHVRTGGENIMMPDTSYWDPDPVRIDLEDTIARGEAVFIRADGSNPLTVDWDNGLLITSERFLEVYGDAVQPAVYGEQIIQLRHLTAITHRGFCRFEVSGSDVLPSLTQITCNDSIIQIGESSSLIEHVGIEAGAHAQSRFVWEEDRTYYSGVDVYWRIVDLIVSLVPQQLHRSEWRDFWALSGSYPMGNITWKSNESSTMPCHRRKPTDYMLGGTFETNPAISGARSGRDAGLLASSLPPLPPDSDRGTGN